LLKKLFVLFLLMGIAFFCGYSFGKRFSPPSQSVALPETVQLPAKPQPETVIPQREVQDERLLNERKAAFKSLMNTCSSHAEDLQAKIDGIARVSGYLRNQTEDAQKARSLEESMVYESRYRESLGAMLALEQELCNMLLSALKYAQDYTGLLEGYVWEKLPLNKTRVSP
jgi:hypothetical protein